MPISAQTGDGVERLAGVLAANLPEAEPAYPEDFLTATPESEWIGEVIREKLLERTREELPFASAVVVESVREDDEKNLTVVTASIVVEREGQKGIVVGARRHDDPRHRHGRPRGARGRDRPAFFLELTVKVRERWRDDERFLSQLVEDPGGTRP